MSWYDRLQDNSDRLMDIDHTDSYQFNPIKNFSFKVKAVPREGMTLEHGNDVVKVETDGKDTWNSKIKTILTADCPAHAMKGKLTANSKETQMRIKHKFSKAGADTADMSWSADASCAPQKDHWTLQAGFKHGGQAFGPITPWTEVS